MPWFLESLPRRVWASVTDFFPSWWKEVTMPLEKSGLSPARGWMRRILLCVPAVVLFGAVFGGAGLYFFTGWRAGDLARKAMNNARAGNLTMARVQIVSANNLRPDSAAVQRALVYVQSRFNDPASLGRWEELAAQGGMFSSEEAEEWARVAAAEGTDEQFARAMAALESGGDASKAAAIRASRSQRRGNLAEAIAQTRKAATDDPAAKLELLAGKNVGSEETAAAMAAAPGDASPRFTHALALLRENRAGDALGVFHDIDIFVDRLPPGDKAIAIALWEANGMNGYATSLRNSLDPALLEKGEYVLLLPSSSADNPDHR